MNLLSLRRSSPGSFASRLGPVFWILARVAAQTCSNGGIQAGSGCSCPIGFGGSDCTLPACGGDLFQGSSRKTSTGNITACSCETDWTGLGCNVCTTANACQTAFTSSGHSTTSVPAGVDTGINDTMTCNTGARVYASGQMSCSVVNPTLQQVYPLKTTLNIIRTLTPSSSPLPNITSFGNAGTVAAHLFYDGVEQFHCQSDSCVQTSNNVSATWTCQNLGCTCISTATFCSPSSFLDLTKTINGLAGTLTIECDPPTDTGASCRFKQDTLVSVFGPSGLPLNGCTFGECVRQNVIDGATNSEAAVEGSKPLSGGVIAGLAVVGALVFFALLFLVIGLFRQRKARKVGYGQLGGARAGVEWNNVTYSVAGSKKMFKRSTEGFTDDKVILDGLTGQVLPGQMMAILGPSGAGKTTLIEILAGKRKSGTVSGTVNYPCASAEDLARLRIGFVPQQDVLPPMLTVYEAILFAARLRLPEGIPDEEKRARVDQLMEKLGIAALRNVRIGWNGDTGGGRLRGISGGEMRRVSIGLELIAGPDILVLDEPTSGLDSVSAARVANVLHSIAHDPENPTAVIASIHQPNSQLYHTFDSILVLSHGRAMYSGPGGSAPADHLARVAPGVVPACPTGYNVADYLLEVASDPPLVLFQQRNNQQNGESRPQNRDTSEEDPEKAALRSDQASSTPALAPSTPALAPSTPALPSSSGSQYATTFLTQLQYLSGREWKILRRDKTLFFTHVAVAAVLGVFCGGLYFHTGVSIAGFQSRVGCLFFLGALIAFSSLSALYNVVEIRPLFLRERSSSYYSPTSWLVSRFIFDVVPLRIIPTIIVSTITYWMAGLAHDAQHYFKFLFILVLYTLAMTLFNFLLGTLFHNGGIAILLSALTALYQMTFAGFFVHLDAIPPVLRWLQWICPLKYTLEALSVNEVGSGLMIQDTLEGVPINVSASLIMNLLFGFGSNNYYRDVLVLFAFIAGFGLGVIGIVWLKIRERR
ncbi:hypothetical protein C8J56DRAFT_869698 [Mycena floridula]|nr:hypothetical protein C8J56DRAFT_869698 [Mycena floridula]